MNESTPKSQGFNPINPAKLSLEEGLAWNRQRLKLSQNNNATIAYSGIDQFMRMIDNGQLGVGCIIRLRNYGMIIDPHYLITSKGLIHATSKDENPHSPQEVFRFDKNGEIPTWEIVGFSPTFEKDL